MLWLEWLAWLSVILSIWMYGFQDWKGPVSGILATALFLMLAGFTNSFPMTVVNIIIMVIHARNLRKSLHT